MEDLRRKDLLKVAKENPGLRSLLVPMLRSSSQCRRVLGVDRKRHMDDVWDMFVLSYRKIGLILSSPQELLEFNVWELCFLGRDEEDPVAFTLYKQTPYGLKSGLGGSDGSPTGKSEALRNIRTKYLRPGIYGEVSHAVEKIALSAGAPVVCASIVPQVLKKQVLALEDGLHYQRALSGVGVVTKILVGNPKGIPTTTIQNPQCEIGLQASFESEEADTRGDLQGHYGCSIF